MSHIDKNGTPIKAGDTIKHTIQGEVKEAVVFEHKWELCASVDWYFQLEEYHPDTFEIVK